MNYIDNQSLGNRIRLQREKLQMTREELAEKIEMSSHHLGHVERGDRSVSLSNLVKISVALNMSLDYLIFGHLEDNTMQIVKLINNLSKSQLDAIEDVIRAILPHVK